MKNATHLDGIHAKRDSSTSRLDALVITSHTGELERLVGDGRHSVVGETLEHGIGQVVGQQQDDRSRRDSDVPVPWDFDAADGGVSTRELNLERETGSPDDAVQDGDGCCGHQCTLPAAAGKVVCQLSDDYRPDNGADTGQKCDQGPRAAVEQCGSDCTLVCVEVVRGEEHGKQRNHAPVPQQGPDLLELLLGRDCLLNLDDCSIATHNEVRRQNEPGRDHSRQHDDQEGQVNTGGDTRQGGIGLDAECDGGTDQGSHLEEGPEEREGPSLVLFKGLRHHDGPLRRPQQRSCDTQNPAGENEKPSCAVDLEGPERADVECVSRRADGEGEPRAQHVLSGGSQRSALGSLPPQWPEWAWSGVLGPMCRGVAARVLLSSPPFSLSLTRLSRGRGKNTYIYRTSKETGDGKAAI